MTMNLKARVMSGKLGVLENHSVVYDTKGCATHTLILGLNKNFMPNTRYVIDKGVFVPLMHFATSREEPEAVVIKRLTKGRAPSVYYMAEQAYCYAKFCWKFSADGTPMGATVMLLPPLNYSNELQCSVVTLSKAEQTAIRTNIVTCLWHRGVFKK